jgi:hypothetical protein
VSLASGSCPIVQQPPEGTGTPWAGANLQCKGPHYRAPHLRKMLPYLPLHTYHTRSALHTLHTLQTLQSLQTRQKPAQPPRSVHFTDVPQSPHLVHSTATILTTSPPPPKNTLPPCYSPPQASRTYCTRALSCSLWLTPMSPTAQLARPSRDTRTWDWVGRQETQM